MTSRAANYSFSTMPTPDMQEEFTRRVSWGNNAAIVKYLDKYGSTIDDQHIAREALTYAASFGLMDTAKLLLERKFPVDLKTGYTGMTALMYAANAGKIEMAQFLLEQGADLNAKDKAGMTALDHASVNRKLELVSFLKNWPDFVKNKEKQILSYKQAQELAEEIKTFSPALTRPMKAPARLKRHL